AIARVSYSPNGGCQHETRLSAAEVRNGSDSSLDETGSMSRRWTRAAASKNLAICEPSYIRAAKKMRAPISPSSTQRRGEANASMDGGNLRRGRHWPDLVGRGDVQIGPRGRLGNEFGHAIAACGVARQTKIAPRRRA